MRTRTKRPTKSKAVDAEEATKTAAVQTLPPSVSNAPHVAILPKDLSPSARILTLPNPATSAPTRYLICPETGRSYEFTRVSAPKRACRSWLLAPDHSSKDDEGGEDDGHDNEAYVLQQPDLMIATPIDPLFLILLALAEGTEGRQEYLAASDYLSRLAAQSEHFKAMMQMGTSSKLEQAFEVRMLTVCDTMEAGDETLYSLSLSKSGAELITKAKKMVANGLPASVEEHFVKRELATPVLSVRREESGVSMASDQDAVAGSETTTSTSQDTQASGATVTTGASFSTTATTFEASTSPPPSNDQSAAQPDSDVENINHLVRLRTAPPASDVENITYLLRLRTALNFLLSSYVPPSLRTSLTNLLSTEASISDAIDFAPLDAHLTHLATLKSEAQALRSISDNISRKRGVDEDDEEAAQKAEAKKRKKEQEEMKKKNTSQGVKKLAKADTSGMKKLSAFFGGKGKGASENTKLTRPTGTMVSPKEHQIYALVEYEDTYVQPLLLRALRSRLPPDLLVFISDLSELPNPSTPVLQWRQYEKIDFDHLTLHSGTGRSLANSYVIRKALIRKHFLSTTVAHWLAKSPESILKDHVKPSVELEVDYAEFLDEALVEAWELKESWARQDRGEGREWWILKPGMSERGEGIRLFSSEEELQAIFVDFENGSPDSDSDEDRAGEDGEPNGDVIATHTSAEERTTLYSNGVVTSQLRHFIAQPYIHPPLLLPSGSHPSAGKKFHLRTYVLAAGALKVWVFREMLALFAGKAYSAPSPDEDGDTEVKGGGPDLSAHLTNTCLQSTGEREGSVHAFWSLPSHLRTLPPSAQDSWQETVFKQICLITSETFLAAARTTSTHFQPLPNAFEIFGVDFLVDAQGKAWLLEVNAFPDFAQTGGELQGLIQGLFEGVVEAAVKPFFGLGSEGEGERGVGEKMVKVLDVDLGRR